MTTNSEQLRDLRDRLDDALGELQNISNALSRIVDSLTNPRGEAEEVLRDGDEEVESEENPAQGARSPASLEGEKP